MATVNPRIIERRPESRVRRVTSNAWLSFFTRRLIALVAVLAVLLFATFMIVRLLPGDPAVYIAGENATQENIDRINAELGLDDPLLDQLGQYVSNAIQLDFGQSFRSREPVSVVISNRLGSSAELALLALVVVMLVGILLGLLVGALTRDGRHRRLDVLYTAVASTAGAVPQFLTATFLAFLFAVTWQVFPVADDGTFSSLVLPVLAVALAPTFIFSRFVRVETLNVLAQDYIRAARSKRIATLRLYLRHILPNVVTGALALSGILFASLIGGAILVENVFARVGLGTALVEAIKEKDYPVVQGVVLVLGMIVVLVNMIVDVIQGLIDPRSLARQS